MFRRVQPHAGFGWATWFIAFVLLGSQITALLVTREFPIPAGRRKIRKLLDSTAYRGVPFIISMLFTFCSFVVLYNPFIYLSSFALLRGVTDQDLGFYMLSVANAATIPGRLVAGFIAGELISYTLGWVIAFAWIAVYSETGLIVWTVAMGFVFGSVISLVVLTSHRLYTQARAYRHAIGNGFRLRRHWKIDRKPFRRKRVG